MEELQCKTVFTIPVFGGIPVAESVAVTWVIMAVLLILSLVLVRNLSVENPGKKQLLLETGVSFLHNFFKDILGEEGKMYIPYLMTVVILHWNCKHFRCVWICTAYKGFKLYDRSCDHKYFSDRVCRIP